jgi:outer membrane protein assembly factor BamD
MKRLILILMAGILLLSACAKQKPFTGSEDKFNAANELYNKKKYARAAELYGDVYFERSSVNLSTALLRQAESYFKINRFSDAREAYEEFIQAFPKSPDIPTAYYHVALCLYEESFGPQYDQAETMASIGAFRTFIQKFPNDERRDKALDYIRKGQYKLIEKTFNNGYIYYKMKDYSAALMYFQEVIDLGNTNDLDRRSLYFAALLNYRQNNLDAAADHFARLKERYPGSKETRKLARYFPAK